LETARFGEKPLDAGPQRLGRVHRILHPSVIRIGLRIDRSASDLEASSACGRDFPSLRRIDLLMPIGADP